MKKQLHLFPNTFFGRNASSKKLRFVSVKKLFRVLSMLFLLSLSLKSSAQTINDNGQQSTVLANGTYQDFVVPNNPQIIKITFGLSGADGGKATIKSGVFVPFVGFSEVNSCTAPGGAGAFAFATFQVGPEANKIPLGSTIRFIVGKKGTNGSDEISVVPGTGSEYGGGGGGTAVLYRPPNGSSWILLGVAGGGGGGYQGMALNICLGLEAAGGGGRGGPSGGDGSGLGYGSGGSDGHGGASNDIFTGGGGGGAFSEGGSVPCINVGEDGELILDVGEGGKSNNGLGDELGGHGGSSEGCSSLLLRWRNGGYGYGGGGGGVGSGGGGGGYSGGGAGGFLGAGGGGGSYINLTQLWDNYGSSGAGATSNPQDGSAYYQVTLNTPPVANCKGSFSVNLDEDGNAIITGDDLNDGSTDAENQELTFSLDKSTFTCADIGENKVTLTVTDAYGATSTCFTTVTVVDNTAPTIGSVTPSVSSLWPNNHRMQEVTVTVNSDDNCPGNCKVISVTSNELENGLGDGDTSPDYEITGDNTVKLRAERSGTGTGRIYTITVQCTDASGNSSTSSTTVVVSHDITSPKTGSAFKVGSTINFAGSFWDIAGSKHTATWLIDGKTTVKGSITEPSGTKNGIVTGSYKFTAPGVYKLQMNITDQKGNTTYVNTNGHLDAIVVVYDPDGGYTYGGGYFYSPAGALAGNPSLKGNVSYGFQNNYYKNSTYPKGETQFNFAVGDFEFNALNFDYLVINKSMAQFKGTGKIIGGQSGIGFTMTVTDGQLDGSGVDKIRTKIYNKNNGQVYYDNQPGANDATLPTQAVGANSTIVIGGSANLITGTSVKEIPETKATEILSSELDVNAFPNPSTKGFTINVGSPILSERIVMQVTDMYGRIVETKNISANTLTKFGEHYQAGTYIIRVMQGKERKEVKLIKLSE